MDGEYKLHEKIHLPINIHIKRGEAAPLVIGVRGAQYWMAPSQLIAHQQFAEAEERGDVQVLFLS